jgi:hypothetical protein
MQLENCLFDDRNATRFVVVVASLRVSLADTHTTPASARHPERCLTMPAGRSWSQRAKNPSTRPALVSPLQDVAIPSRESKPSPGEGST